MMESITRRLIIFMFRGRLDRASTRSLWRNGRVWHFWPETAWISRTPSNTASTIAVCRANRKIKALVIHWSKEYMDYKRYFLVRRTEKPSQALRKSSKMKKGQGLTSNRNASLTISGTSSISVSTSPRRTWKDMSTR